MQKELRQQFNTNFTEEKYNAYMQKVEALHAGALDFRNAETPIFIPKAFTKKMLGACEDIIDVITAPNFKQLTERSIPKNLRVSGEDAHTQFIVFDFGICENANGELEPQLVEMQGFPTLFGFQIYYPEVVKKHFNIPENFDNYLGGYNK